MRRSTLAIAILALLPIVVLSVAVPCPQMTLVRKTRTSVAYFIGAGTISVSPYSDGTIYDDNKMMWDMSMLVERNRSLGNADGSFNYPFCVNPSGGHGIALLDPLLPNVPGEPCPGTYGTGSVCGIVTSYLLVKDMMCDVQEVTEPFYGFTRESVYVTMTHPAYPEFKLVAGHHLVNGSVNVYPLANNTWVVNRYITDVLKLSYEIEGYPWNGSTLFNPGGSNEVSTVSLWYNISLTVQPGELHDLSTDSLSRKLEYVSADNKTTLAIDLSSVYIADGTPYVIESPDGGWGTIPIQLPLQLDLTMATALCNQTLGHWTKAEYDPTFGVLFSPDPTTPSGKFQKGLNGSQIAAIAVVVPVVVIVVAIAIGFTIYKRSMNAKGSAQLHNQKASLGS